MNFYMFKTCNNNDNNCWLCPPLGKTSSFNLQDLMCLRVWQGSDQWLPRAPPLPPPSPPPLCLRISIMKPSTLCSATWECCLLNLGDKPQVKVGTFQRIKSKLKVFVSWVAGDVLMSRNSTLPITQVNHCQGHAGLWVRHTCAFTGYRNRHVSPCAALKCSACVCWVLIEALSDTVVNIVVGL